MFSHKSFLCLGNIAQQGVNLDSLFKDGYELSQCNYSFLKSIDHKGQVQSQAVGGIIELSITTLPTNELIEWSLNSRRYLDGSIVFCNSEGIAIEKVYFTHAACVSMEISYIQAGSAYITTNLTINTKTMTFGRITFESNWINK